MQVLKPECSHISRETKIIIGKQFSRTVTSSHVCNSFNIVYNIKGVIHSQFNALCAQLMCFWSIFYDRLCNKISVTSKGFVNIGMLVTIVIKM